MRYKSSALNADRYHAVMGNFLLGVDPAGMGESMGHIPATFYVTQRKLPYAPCVGHNKLVDLLHRSQADAPRARYLSEDRAKLTLIAKELQRSGFPGRVDAVSQGTIVFAGEPFALVSGPFAMTQMFEVAFEHAFDRPMTFAGLAMEMREAAGDEAFLSDFSLRRADEATSLDVAEFSYIGGFNDTSNLEASFIHDIPSVGTMAHYLVQAFMAYVSAYVSMVLKRGASIPTEWYSNPRSGVLKHPERICFEYWLDAHPNGTVCLVDTISLESGMTHVIEAALSWPRRRKALRAVRLDSGDLVKGAIYIRLMLNLNGLSDVGVILTGDLNAEAIRQIRIGLGAFGLCAENFVFAPTMAKDLVGAIRNTEQGKILGYGIGTKLAAEIEHVAGVIFKLAMFAREPTLKCSGTPGKGTLPGRLQLWRCENQDGFYVMDVVGRDGELIPLKDGIVKATPLIQPFFAKGAYPELKTINEQKAFVEFQKSKFGASLEQYAKGRVRLTPALEQLRAAITEQYRDEFDLSRIKRVDPSLINEIMQS